MNVGILVFANNRTGLGHWYRAVALADFIKSRNHKVSIIGDRRPLGFNNYHHVPYVDQTLWRSPLQSKLDWLVIDLPDEAPSWLYDYCQANNIKTCILNGVGHQVGDRADLRIVQGLGAGEYSGVDYIILRPSVFEAKAIRRPIIEWFVFGGAADKMGLTKRFPDEQRISFSISNSDWQAGECHDNGFLVAASQCRRACVAMGMTAWELVAMGLPVYVFSLTELHLSFAWKMHQAGYIKSWDEIGIPGRREMMIDFLAEPFVPTGKPIDGQACRRILNLMED